MLDAPSGLLATDAETLEAFARDRSALSLLRPLDELPAAVARPSTTGEVAALLRWADESKTPVVPRGLGSGVCGGAAALGGSVVLTSAGSTASSRSTRSRARSPWRRAFAALTSSASSSSTG